MLEKLGSKAIAAPFALVVVLTCVLSLAVAPILQASPHDISLAIVNLDEGVQTPAGTMNAGAVLESQMTGEESDEAQETTETMAKLAALSAAANANAASAQTQANANAAASAQAHAAGANANTAANAANAQADAVALASTQAAVSATASAESTDTDSDSDDSASSAMADALSWQSIENEDDLQNQLADNRLFGGIVIPADFTAQQMAAKNSPGAKPQITVYLNKGKNPQVASSLQSAMTQSLAAAGIDATIEMVNDAEVGGGMMAGLMAVQMMVMPLLVMTLSGSLILVLLTWVKDIWGLRARNPWLAAGAQVALIAVLSACIAACALAIDVLAGGLTLPCGQLFLWLWLGSACVMLAFAGISDACFPLGALFAVCVFALGMGTAMLPAEMMPAFWADWIFPWAPQSHLGQGARTIIYCSQNPGMADIAPLLIFAAIGNVAALLAAGLAQAKQKKAAAAA